MSDTAVYALLTVLGLLGVTAYVAATLIGYVAARRTLREYEATIRCLRGQVHYLVDVIAEHCPQVVRERVAHQLSTNDTPRGRHER